ncbi:MAG: ABC transporter permease [Bacillota bacterium]|nr:ABC transporter permease [Bacillota bacterium]MDI7248672.1 ABC transporter permease [Bacillota bacterium]
MGSYVVRRVLQFIPVWLGVAILVFSMVHLIPGDPVRAMTGGRPLSAEAVARARQALGLDDPLPVQLGRFMWRAVRGDLGTSLQSGRPVAGEFLDRFPSTLELALAGLGLGMLAGVVLGVLAAVRQGSSVDRGLLLGSLVFVSVPGFWFGLMLIYLFSVWLGWLPVGGQGGLRALVMPALTLAVGTAAVLMRLTRASMLEVLRADYVRTARAKGLSERVVLYKHALRNALNPVVTVVGLVFGALLGGAFIVEQVFSRPGVGRLAVQAIFARDFPMIQGIVLYSSTVFLLTNLLVDLSYALLDPRIRYR